MKPTEEQKLEFIRDMLICFFRNGWDETPEKIKFVFWLIKKSLKIAG